jgi:hypothetical protein
MFREWKKARLGERETRETTVTQITGAAQLHQVLMRVVFAKDAFEMYGLIAYAPTGEAEVTAGFKALIKVLRGAEASAVIVCAVKDVVQARKALIRWLTQKMKELVEMVYAQMLIDGFDGPLLM